VGSAETYAKFAEEEVKGYSATYFEWARSIAQDRAVTTLIDQLPYRCQQPNLVFAACRFLGIEPGSYATLRTFLLKNWHEVTDLVVHRRTQTNEPGRCAVLLPILASLPQPLALLEVGASAGLCLYPDRYSYIYDAEHHVDPVDGISEVVISCTTRGSAALPDSLPTVVWRAGIDVNPLDVRDGDSMRWLEALVWPEQEFRLTRLRAAIEIAKSDPPRLFEGDLVERLSEVANNAPKDATLVIFHSAVLTYLDEDRRRDFIDQVRSLPAIWIANENVGVVPSVRRVVTTPHQDHPTPFVLARDGVPIGFAGAHGQTLEWF
jgi:hypothetical protein